MGTAAWAVPQAVRALFPAGGSLLEQYAAVFGAVEINTSSYRPHQPKTYERWAASVPQGFRFAVKLPRTITHERRLVGTGPLLAAFLHQAAHLGTRLGPVLVQLPPSLALDTGVAGPFLALLRQIFAGAVVLEPRHPTWFGAEAGRMLLDHQVARVAADPARLPEGAEPGGWPSLAYLRLHGSPRTYYSEYGEARLAKWARRVRAWDAEETWCVLDNTALGAATGDALALRAILQA